MHTIVEASPGSASETVVGAEEHAAAQPAQDATAEPVAETDVHERAEVPQPRQWADEGGWDSRAVFMPVSDVVPSAASRECFPLCTGISVDEGGGISSIPMPTRILRIAARHSHAIILQLHGGVLPRFPGQNSSRFVPGTRSARFLETYARALGGVPIRSADSEASYGRDYERSGGMGPCDARVSECTVSNVGRFISSIAMGTTNTRPGLLESLSSTKYLRYKLSHSLPYHTSRPKARHHDLGRVTVVHLSPEPPSCVDIWKVLARTVGGVRAGHVYVTFRAFPRSFVPLSALRGAVLPQDKPCRPEVSIKSSLKTQGALVATADTLKISRVQKCVRCNLHQMPADLFCCMLSYCATPSSERSLGFYGAR
ncbi:hypothetical protein FB451DRAFT_1175214 [Mycena latifolia]|nr:hypothetical protein FB451DRAFT_1175214 [Mycena latifolia]